MEPVLETVPTGDAQPARGWTLILFVVSTDTPTPTCVSRIAGKYKPTLISVS